jgi:hypothetical protein
MCSCQHAGHMHVRASGFGLLRSAACYGFPPGDQNFGSFAFVAAST